MHVRWNVVVLATLVAGSAVLVTGCGGIMAAPAISPLMFLLPGVGQVRPAPGSPAPAPLSRPQVPHPEEPESEAGPVEV